MSNVKSGLKKMIPASWMRFLGNSYDAILRLPDEPAACFHPWRVESRHQMTAYHNQHRGERCFIIGNGPSLRNTDLGRLRHEYTIGLNRIYLMFDELGWLPSYYLCVNDLVIEQSSADIQRLRMPRFVSWRSRKWLRSEPNLSFVHTTYTGPQFATDFRGRVWEGGTVTYVALQLAYFLGFSQVILIGVDHNYVNVGQGKPNETVVSQGADPNHFSADYFGKGFRWQLPDLESWENAYRMARRAYEKDRREVLDATVGGKLMVFKKADYRSLFSSL